ncbi:MAG: nicotinamide riboside transporter PnuC, partial [Eubacterium sp.]|nr:nicotinamide riboside transporter PnuC [Eubacterium sp.]
MNAFFVGGIIMKICSKLSKTEFMIWLFSIVLIMVSFLFVSQKDYLTLVASLIGATALIYVAKGEPLGQILTVVFSVFYSVISLKFHYYGEMITYLGMTAPIALMSTVSWLKNPYKKGEAEVKISRLSRNKILLMIVLTALVTFGFYFILKFFNTANLFMSTVSIATSFSASYLMLFRNPYYAVAYASNDIVLIILWVLATINDISYLPMIICFVIFFINDLFG